MKIEIPKSGYLRIKVTPSSPKTELINVSNDDIDNTPTTTYHIRLKAPPEKGKANEELIRFLSKETGTARSNITILSGKTSRIKLIKITPA